MIKRIFIFLLLNILIVLTISFALNIFHVAPYLTSYGLDYKSLAVFCLLWGMGGSIISLLLSRYLAKWMLSVKLIDSSTNDTTSKILIKIVTKLSHNAGLSVVPQIGIFENREPNAFATGPSKKRSLIAVSTGLLNILSEEELEGVIGHEISHIANGDMVTMTLLQGVVNAFVMFMARAIAFAISSIVRDNRGRRQISSYGSYMLLTFVFEIVFMLLGSIVIAYFSRIREYRADKGSKEMVGKEPMINALKKLQLSQTIDDTSTKQQSIAALMINCPKKLSRILSIFATHPSIEKRIARLNK